MSSDGIGEARGPLPGGTEVIPSATTLIARADAIALAINRLRNAVQGRGVHPKGPPELAERVNTAQLEWRDARAQFFDGANLISEAYETAAALEQWERAVNELTDQAAALGLVDASERLPVTHTLTPGEAAEQFGQGLTRGLNTVAIVGIGLALIWLWGRR